MFVGGEMREPMSTYVCNPGEAERKWMLVDAEGQTLGRLSTFVAKMLMGKHRPIYTPFADTGDFVIVVNAAKVRLTGRKHEQKFYRWHTGYPGGLKEIAAGKVLKTKPTRVIEWSVKGMLPKGSLGRRQGMKLKVYAGPEHPHQAQKPEKISIPA
jgi:large subunit ribosomal protein L13